MIFATLDKEFPLPIIIVQHISPETDNYLPSLLDNLKKIKVKEADEKEIPQKGVAYVAPPNYHLLIEGDRSFTLTVGERVNYARPSIDVLFETAAESYLDGLIGIILTGANNDGSQGLKKIKEIFTRHNTRYKIIISPIYDQIPLEQEQLNLLYEVFGKENVYDFSGKNRFTEPISNYYETVHFKPYVAHEILNIVYQSNKDQ